MFDPVLNAAQIVVLQCLLYLSLCGFVLTFGIFDSSTMSLSLIFDPSLYDIRSSVGWAAILSWLLNSVTSSFWLLFVVKRAKQCLDFTVTVHIVHFIIVWVWSVFPKRWEWWISFVMSAVVMTLLGEYICMRYETREIQLHSLLGRGRPVDEEEN